MDYTTLLLALIALALGGFFIGRERSVVLARSLPGGPRLHSLPGHYGYFVVIWSLLPALTLVILIFLLSFRLREREMLTYMKIGATAFTIRLLKANEVLFVLGAGVVLALLANLLTKSLAADLLPKLLS